MMEKVFIYLSRLGILLSFIGMCIAKYYGQEDILKMQSCIMLMFIIAMVVKEFSRE